VAFGCASAAKWLKVNDLIKDFWSLMRQFCGDMTLGAVRPSDWGDVLDVW